MERGDRSELEPEEKRRLPNAPWLQSAVKKLRANEGGGDSEGRRLLDPLTEYQQPYDHNDRGGSFN